MISNFVKGNEQRDGRVFVTETHIDDFGIKYVIEYLSPPNADNNAIMESRAIDILNQLKTKELDDLVISPKYNTNLEYINGIRFKFLKGSGEEVARTAKWIMDGLDSGRFTVVQIRNAFSLNINQWNTLQAKLINLRSSIELIDSAIGE